MKKSFIGLIIISVMLLCGCSDLSGDDVPEGYVNKAEHFQEEGSQDYTDYCKYEYDSATYFESADEYNKVTAAEIENIKAYFDNFSSWMEIENRLEEYDFDDTCIDERDYVRIVNKEEEGYDKFDYYSICYFDKESLTLYYIHNSI